MADVEVQLLAELAERQAIANSSDFATSREIGHDKVVGIIKSLQAAGLVEAEVSSRIHQCTNFTSSVTTGTVYHMWRS